MCVCVCVCWCVNILIHASVLALFGSKLTCDICHTHPMSRALYLQWTGPGLKPGPGVYKPAEEVDSSAPRRFSSLVLNNGL